MVISVDITKPNFEIIDVEGGVTADVAAQITKLAKSVPRAHYLQDPDRAPLGSGSVGTFKLALTRLGDELVASSVITEVRKKGFNGLMLFIDRGPLATNEQVMTDHLNNIVSVYEKIGLAICISPYVFDEDAECIGQACESIGFARKPGGERQYLGTLELVMEADQDRNFCALSPAFRRQIKKSERMGLRVKDGNFCDTVLYDCFRNHYCSRGLDFPRFETWEELDKDPANNFLLTGLHDKRIVSGIMCAAFGRSVVFCYSFANEQAVHLGLPATHALHWAAITRSVEYGHEIYDLGGYWKDRGSKDPINFFKQQIGSEFVETAGEFEYTFPRLVARTFVLLRMLARRQ